MLSNKQTPIKIRNVFSNLSTTPSAQTATNSSMPLRTLVLNAKDPNILKATPNLSVGSSTAMQPLNSSSSSSSNLAMPVIHSVQYAATLHKQCFPHVQFKCLSFEELAQHSVITKTTDELTIVLLKQLDERVATVINQEQREAFAKNQIRLVRKYLEQQQIAKGAIKARMNEQLSKDQRMVQEPEYRQPFLDKTEAIKRLSRYHVLQKTFYEPKEEEAKKCKVHFSKGTFNFTYRV